MAPVMFRPVGSGYGDGSGYGYGYGSGTVCNSDKIREKGQ